MNKKIIPISGNPEENILEFLKKLELKLNQVFATDNILKKPVWDIDEV